MAAAAIFYPAAGGGKYHRANRITGQALCRGTILVDLDDACSIHHRDGDRLHPVCCARCAKAT